MLGESNDILARYLLDDLAAQEEEEMSHAMRPHKIARLHYNTSPAAGSTTFSQCPNSESQDYLIALDRLAAIHKLLTDIAAKMAIVEPADSPAKPFPLAVDVTIAKPEPLQLPASSSWFDFAMLYVEPDVKRGHTKPVMLWTTREKSDSVTQRPRLSMLECIGSALLSFKTAANTWQDAQSALEAFYQLVPGPKGSVPIGTVYKAIRDFKKHGVNSDL